MNEDAVTAPTHSPAPADPAAPPARGRVVVLHESRSAAADGLAKLIEAQLLQNGYSVFVDRETVRGIDWARTLTREIRQADAVVPLLSAESADSETLGFEVETAQEARRDRRGRPGLLPVRAGYTGPLPEPLAGILAPLPYQLWETENDNLGVITELLDALRHLPTGEPPTAIVTPPPEPKPNRISQPANPASSPTLGILQAGRTAIPETGPPGGAVPLGSRFYVVRNADPEIEDAVTQGHSIVLIKGARQMGKTSLLARGLQQARENQARVTLTDFQSLSSGSLEDTKSLYLTLAESLADQLGLNTLPASVWDERRGPNVNFERYLRREVLAKFDAPLVWGLDEVDRLLATHYASEVFGLFRAWHNQRALDPSGPWSHLTLVISYATEAHLFISDLNQSPFNVGTRIVLEDFTLEQVADLNRRQGEPLRNGSEISRFYDLVGGHPYLVRRGLYELATRKMDVAAWETEASSDDGVFADHLRRILILLARDPELAELARSSLEGLPGASPEHFYRLRSAGVVSGVAPEDIRPRCRVYAEYLRRHLG